MRDITLAETIYPKFTTRAFATGIPTVLAGSPIISAYADGSTTQITAGITLGVDHDSVVGLNMITVVATGANGYEAGKEYQLIITTGTVGGVSVVGEIVYEFTIDSSASLKAVDLQNDVAATDIVSAGAITTSSGSVSTVTTVGTTTTNTDMRGTDSAALASVCTETRLQALTDWLNGGRLDLLLDAIPTTAMRGTDSAALASVCTETRLQALTDWLDGGRLDLLLDAIPTTAMRGTDSAALASVCTETRLQALTDWLNGGRLDLLLDAIPTTAMRGTDSALLASSINLTAGAVDNVTTVGTTTTNSDMRGTDSAATATALATAQTDLDTLTGSDGATLATTQGNYAPAKAADILTTALTESYAADGAAGTLTQILFLIQQALTEFAIAGTTTTIKKIDGSTSAATLTLDDATNPTSATRAT